MNPTGPAGLPTVGGQDVRQLCGGAGGHSNVYGKYVGRVESVQLGKAENGVNHAVARRMAGIQADGDPRILKTPADTEIGEICRS